jgi:hypothetical protein
MNGYRHTSSGEPIAGFVAGWCQWRRCWKCLGGLVDSDVGVNLRAQDADNVKGEEGHG